MTNLEKPHAVTKKGRKIVISIIGPGLYAWVVFPLLIFGYAM